MRKRVAAVLFSLAGVSLSFGAETRTFTIQEPFGLAWGPDRVTYAVEFPQGEVRPAGVGLTDGAGQPVAVQVTDVELWPDGKSVKKASVHFMASLQPGQRAAWTLTADKRTAKQPKTDVEAGEAHGGIELANARTGVRLAGGKKTYAPAVDAKDVPAPLQAVRLSDGRWIGKGRWQADSKCTGYAAEIVEKGPVFARAKLRYEFEGGKFYAATVELSAGQDLAVVSEEYNLSEGKRYPMTGVNGMRPDVQYGYVYPKFEPAEKALIWDWWGQTMAKLPTPSEYVFSFS